MIDFNATLFIQFANFIFLIFILNFLLFRPLRRVLHQRREEVEGAHARVDSLDKDIAAQTAEYETRLAEARSKGNEEKSLLRSAALEEEKKLLEEAQEMAVQRRAVVRKQIGKEMVEARKTLKNEADVLSQDVAAKVLGRAI